MIVADGGPGIGCGDLSTDYGAIYGWPTMNAADQIAFLTLHKTDPVNLLVTDASPNWFAYKGLSLRPFMADDGSIVVRHTSDATNPVYKLLLMNYGLTTLQTLATTSSGFSVLGRSPGISDEGRIIAFYGQDASGPGIFAAFKTPSGTWERRRVVSLSDGPQAAFNRFEPDARVTVNDAGILAYAAYDQTGNKGLFTSKINFFSTDPSDQYRYRSSAAAIPIALTRDSASGIAIQDVDLYDPINRDGLLAFWAQTPGGEAIIRAEQLAKASDYSDRIRHGAYVNQYSAGAALNLPVSSPTAGSKRGGDACGPSSLTMLMNAINYARNDETRLDLKDVYSATMTLSWSKDKQGKDVWQRNFDWYKGQAYVRKLGYQNAVVITGKAAIDAQLAQGVPVLASTRFSSRAAPALGGGHVILLLGRTANGDYIVNDPAGDYFSAPNTNTHYGAWKNGEYRIYPEAEVAKRLLASDGKSGRSALAIPPIRSSSASAAAAADETLFVIGHSRVGARPFDLWIQNSAGQMTGFLPDGRQVEEIPASSAVINPMIPSDPDAPPEAEVDPAAWPYAISVDAPGAGTRIFIHGDQASDYSLEVVRYRAGRVINQVLTGNVAAGETLEFDVSQAPPATLDVYPGSLAPVVEIGSAEPLSYTIYIRNNGEGDLNWNASANRGWLRLGAVSGAAPYNLDLAIDPSGLSAGPHTGTITLTAPGALNSPTIVQVLLTVGNVTGTDLTVTKIGAPNPATVNKSLTYTVTAINNGPAPATGVILTDTLPTSVTLVSAIPSQGSCSGVTSVTCQLGSLAAGASATIALIVVPTSAGSVANVASVTANESDPNLLNNVVTQTMNVELPPNLLIVTKTADTADGACDADCSLREAIIAANDSPGADIITVPAGRYTLTRQDGCNDPENGALKITAPVTINGAGRDLTVIDGSGLAVCGGVLVIQGSERIAVALSGLTIRHSLGGEQHGGIRASSADLSVNNSVVMSNTGRGIDLSEGGLVLQTSTVAGNTEDGIHTHNSIVTLTNSSVVSNTGGGLSVGADWYTYGSLTVQSSTVAWNDASGIYAHWVDAVVSDSSVVSNTGGGIYWSNSKEDENSLTILRSVINGNTAGSSGGGINALGGSLILQDSTITRNTARNNNGGGGIQAQVDRARITNTVISHNIATGFGGGGLLFNSGSLDIVGSTIEYNAARQSGGGLYASSSTAMTIQDSSISHNTAGPEAETGIQTSGGGLYMDNAGPLALTRVTVAGNQALGSSPSGGGITSNSGLALSGLALVGSTVRDNVARKTDPEDGCGSANGGGIDSFGSPVIITGTTFINNRAINTSLTCGASSGGGLLVSFASYTVTNSSFISNSAGSGGGLHGSEGGIRNTVFLSNTASAGWGGGLYSNGDTTAISVTLRGNRAVGSGGGASGNLALTGSRVEGNTASGDGGGLSGPTQVLSSTITGNRAANGGGIAVGPAVEVVASTISANTAATDGGGIYVPWAFKGGPVVTVRNSTLSGNSAARGGAFNDAGGLSSSGRFTSKAHFINSTVVSNTASSQIGGIYHAGYIGYDEYEQADPQELTLENTLLSNARGNCAAPADDPTFISYGHNLSSDNKCLGLNGPGDLNGVAAQVGPLQDNGGPTATHALLSGSPAIDAAGAANCPPADQRGIARPQGGGCDIGAFEWVPTVPYLHIAPTSLAFTAVVCAAPPAGQPVTVTNTGAGTFDWSATKNQAWLSVAPTAGAAPANPQVSVNHAGLAAGAYTGAATFAAASAGGSPQTVTVTLAVVRDSDLVRNGGFEADPNGAWTESSTHFAHVIRPANELGAYIPPHDGSWAALMGVQNGEVSELTQSVLVPPGVTTLLKYWYYIASPETDCTFDSALIQVNGVTVAEPQLCQAGNTAGWVEGSVPLTAYAGQQVALRFRVINDPSSDPSVFMLDDVRLAIDPPCVPPTITRLVYLPLVLRAP